MAQQNNLENNNTSTSIKKVQQNSTFNAKASRNDMEPTLQRWIGIWKKIDSVTKTSHHLPSKFEKEEEI